jgi:hypothetical protein
MFVLFAILPWATQVLAKHPEQKDAVMKEQQALAPPMPCVLVPHKGYTGGRAGGRAGEQERRRRDETRCAAQVFASYLKKLIGQVYASAQKEAKEARSPGQPLSARVCACVLCVCARLGV